MDVVLDSNAFLSDIRMESIRFKNLFDYLRRTKSLLMIPRLVREEVVARYAQLLAQQAQRTADSIKAFNRLILNSSYQIHFHSPNPKYEVRDLRKKLRAPAKKIGCILYADVHKIDVNEVFLRGIKRRRPASDVGEELRDVILWLIVLQYARAENREVGFITADKGFWATDDIHEHIKEDIKRYEGRVMVFRTIEDFVKSKSPTAKKIDEPEVSEFFDVKSITTELTDRAKEALSTSSGRHRGFSFFGTVRSAQLTKVELQAATLYGITADTKLAELGYAFTMTAEVVSASEDFSQAFKRFILTNEPPNPFSGLGYPSLAPTTSVFGFLGPGREAMAPARTSSESEGTRLYNVTGRTSVSVRLVEEKSSEIELELVEILGVEKMTTAGA